MSAKIGDWEYISNREYHDRPEIGSSDLKTILNCPRKYVAETLRAETKSKRRGSLIHTLVLEPDRLHEDYVIVDVGSRNAKKYKEAVEKNSDGHAVVLAHEVVEAQAIADNVLSSDAWGMLTRGIEPRWIVSESSIFWEEGGVVQKCRPDLLIKDAHESGLWTCVDLKTTRDASPAGFAKSVVQYGYDLSAAHYTQGIRSAGIEIEAFVLLAVETTEPYVVQGYVLGPDALERGDYLRSLALQKFARLDEECPEGYCQYPIDDLIMPAWSMRILDEGEL